MLNTEMQKKSTVRHRDLFLLVSDIFVVFHEGELYGLVMTCDLFNNDI